MAEPRSAKLVIDQAIRDNRPWEWLCFVSSAVLVALGVSVIVRAMVSDQSAVVTVTGAIASALFWPALGMGQRVRKENQAIRLLEVPLTKAKTEEAAANMLREMFQQIYVEKKG